MCKFGLGIETSAVLHCAATAALGSAKIYYQTIFSSNNKLYGYLIKLYLRRDTLLLKVDFLQSKKQKVVDVQRQYNQ